MYRISPKEAKRAISGTGTSGKIGVQDAVKDHEHLVFQQEKNKEKLTEHIADSIAIAYAFIINKLPSLIISK